MPVGAAAKQGGLIMSRPPSRLPRSTRSFTLVELLVVIAIIAVLASMLLPSLSNAKNVAKSACCKNNLKHYMVANGFYANDYNEACVPYNFYYNADNPSAPWVYNLTYRSYLGFGPAPSGYLTRFPDGIICPSARMPWLPGNAEPGWGRVIYATGMIYSTVLPPYGAPWRVYCQKKVIHPTERFLLADGNYVFLKQWQSGVSYWNLYGDTATENERVAYRHAETANLAFFDGHVEALRKERVATESKLWTPYD
jgi:prepilin-type processing-associated H-X9-DG protein/prepilin-type N-terminal cleavage/methylation domain-containing protein